VRMLCTLATLTLLALTPGARRTTWADAPPLKGVPELRVEDLGPMALKANLTLGPLAPNPTGTGFVQLLFAFPPGDLFAPKGPFEILAVDLQTGAIPRARARTQAGSVGWRVWRWEWGADGKLYLGTQGPGHLISWDPKTQTARDHGLVWQHVDMA
jgi:hypothetical protein